MVPITRNHVSVSYAGRRNVLRTNRSMSGRKSACIQPIIDARADRRKQF